MAAETDEPGLGCVVRRQPAPWLQPRDRTDEHDRATRFQHRNGGARHEEVAPQVDVQRHVPFVRRRPGQTAAAPDADVADDTVEPVGRRVGDDRGARRLGRHVTHDDATLATRSVISAAVADAAPSSRSAHTTAAPSRIARRSRSVADRCIRIVARWYRRRRRAPVCLRASLRMVRDRTSAPNRAEQTRTRRRPPPSSTRPRRTRATIRRIARHPTRRARDRLRAVRSRTQASADRGWGSGVAAGRPSGGSAAADRTPVADLRLRVDRQPRGPGVSQDVARVEVVMQHPPVRRFEGARAVLRRLRRPTAAGAVDRDGPGVR